MSVRIVLIHAVSVAIEPVGDAFGELWPEAELVNVLDDSLSRDLSTQRGLTPEMHRRFDTLTGYASGIGAHGVLFTCSAFGAAIDAARADAPVPVLKPNEAMFDEALRSGRRIGMLATFEPSVGSMEREFRAAARAAGADAEIETLCVPAAMTALVRGDGDTHDRLLADAAASLGHCDGIMLAQFSTARARGAVADAAGVPVLTSPHSAVRRLRERLA